MACASDLRCERRSATIGSVAETAGYKTSYSWYFFLAIFRRLDDGWGKMNATIEFLRRLGPDPHANGAMTIAVRGCPDIFELQSGDFAVIGIDITSAASPKLPPSAGCGPDERIVLVPRKTLVLAKPDIPETV